MDRDTPKAPARSPQDDSIFPTRLLHWGRSAREASRQLRAMDWGRSQPPFHDSDFEPEPWSVLGPLTPSAGQ